MSITQVGDDYLNEKVLQDDSEAHVIYVTYPEDPAVFVGEVLADIASRNAYFTLVQVDGYSVEFAVTYQVLSLPTIFIFKRGKLVSTLGPFVPAELMEETITRETRPRSVDLLLAEINRTKSPETDEADDE